MPIQKDARKAGKWGDYNCDIPKRTFQNMLDFISSNQDEFNTSFITWTGDNSPHFIWESTDDEVVESTVKITDLFKETFGPNSTI